MARRQLSEAEHESRRAEDRERIARAVRELQSSDGWRRWVAVRRHNGLCRYSLNNQLLVATECWHRQITPTYIAGYRWWSGHGYQVRTGERAISILAPVRRLVTDAETGERRSAVVGFQRAAVFERSQVDAAPDAEPLSPESQPIEGDSHEHFLTPLASMLEADGIRVDFAAIDVGGARGYFDRKQRLIRVERGLAPNARLRILFHEAAHALVAAELADADEDSPGFSYAEEECVVETAGHVAAAALGLDTSDETVPYIAGWGEAGALDVVQRAAALVDRIAGRLEQAAAGGEADEPQEFAEAA